jgi:hypothetical protein
MIKALKKLRIEGMFLNIIKAIRQMYHQHYTKQGKTEINPAKDRYKTGCPLCPLLLNIALKFLVRAVR